MFSSLCNLLSPKAWLASYLAHALSDWCFVDPSDIATNLLEDCGIALSNVLIRSGGHIDGIKLNWAWASSGIADVSLQVSGVHIIIQHPRPGTNSANNDQPSKLSPVEEPADAISWKAKYFQQIMDHLTVTVTDVYISIMVSKDTSINVTLDTAELTTISAIDSKLDQSFKVAGLKATLLLERLNDDAELPLLDSFDCAAQIKRISGRRFVDGVATGLLVESYECSPVNFHVGPVQLRSIMSLQETWVVGGGANAVSMASAQQVDASQVKIHLPVIGCILENGVQVSFRGCDLCYHFDASVCTIICGGGLFFDESVVMQPKHPILVDFLVYHVSIVEPEFQDALCEFVDDTPTASPTLQLKMDPVQLRKVVDGTRACMSVLAERSQENNDPNAKTGIVPSWSIDAGALLLLQWNGSNGRWAQINMSQVKAKGDNTVQSITWENIYFASTNFQLTILPGELAQVTNLRVDVSVSAIVESSPTEVGNDLMGMWNEINEILRMEPPPTKAPTGFTELPLSLSIAEANVLFRGPQPRSGEISIQGIRASGTSCSCDSVVFRGFYGDNDTIRLDSVSMLLREDNGLCLQSTLCVTDAWAEGLCCLKSPMENVTLNYHGNLISIDLPSLEMDVFQDFAGGTSAAKEKDQIYVATAIDVPVAFNIAMTSARLNYLPLAGRTESDLWHSIELGGCKLSHGLPLRNWILSCDVFRFCKDSPTPQFADVGAIEISSRFEPNADPGGLSSQLWIPYLGRVTYLNASVQRLDRLATAGGVLVSPLNGITATLRGGVLVVQAPVIEWKLDSPIAGAGAGSIPCALPCAIQAQLDGIVVYQSYASGQIIKLATVGSFRAIVEPIPHSSKSTDEVKQFQQIMDHLTATVTDAHISIMVNEDTSINITLDHAELKTLISSDSTLNQSLKVAGLKATLLLERLNDDAELPLLDSFDCAAQIKRISGRRFVDGVTTGLLVESYECSPVNFHVGPVQLQSIISLQETWVVGGGANAVSMASAQQVDASQVKIHLPVIGCILENGVQVSFRGCDLCYHFDASVCTIICGGGLFFDESVVMQPKHPILVDFLVYHVGIVEPESQDALCEFVDNTPTASPTLQLKMDPVQLRKVVDGTRACMSVLAERSQENNDPNAKTGIVPSWSIDAGALLSLQWNGSNGPWAQINMSQVKAKGDNTVQSITWENIYFASTNFQLTILPGELAQVTNLRIDVSVSAIVESSPTEVGNDLMGMWNEINEILRMEPPPTKAPTGFTELPLSLSIAEANVLFRGPQPRSGEISIQGIRASGTSCSCNSVVLRGFYGDNDTIRFDSVVMLFLDDSGLRLQSKFCVTEAWAEGLCCLKSPMENVTLNYHGNLISIDLPSLEMDVFQDFAGGTSAAKEKDQIYVATAIDVPVAFNIAMTSARLNYLPLAGRTESDLWHSIELGGCKLSHGLPLRNWTLSCDVFRFCKDSPTPQLADVGTIEISSRFEPNADPGGLSSQLWIPYLGRVTYLNASVQRLDRLATAGGVLVSPLNGITATLRGGVLVVQAPVIEWKLDSPIAGAGAGSIPCALPCAIQAQLDGIVVYQSYASGQIIKLATVGSFRAIVEPMPHSPKINARVMEATDLAYLNMFRVPALTASAVLHSDRLDIFSMVKIDLDHAEITADFLSDGWNRPLEDPSASIVYQLPNVKVSELEISLNFVGRVAKIKNARLKFGTFVGRDNTDSSALASHYTKQVKKRIPYLLLKTDVMGNSLGDSMASVAAGVAMKSTVGGSVAGVVGYDVIGSAISAGKERRGASESERYKFGDLSRGVVASVGKAAARGASFRSDDKYQFGDITAGATSAATKYTSENRVRLSAAGGSSIGMLAGLAVAGPLGLVGGALLGGKIASTAVAGLAGDPRKERERQQSSGPDLASKQAAKHNISSRDTPADSKNQNPPTDFLALDEQPLWDSLVGLTPKPPVPAQTSCLHTGSLILHQHSLDSKPIQKQERPSSDSFAVYPNPATSPFVSFSEHMVHQSNGSTPAQAGLQQSVKTNSCLQGGDPFACVQGGDPFACVQGGDPFACVQGGDPFGAAAIQHQLDSMLIQQQHGSSNNHSATLLNTTESPVASSPGYVVHQSNQSISAQGRPQQFVQANSCVQQEISFTPMAIQHPLDSVSIQKQQSSVAIHPKPTVSPSISSPGYMVHQPDHSLYATQPRPQHYGQNSARALETTGPKCKNQPMLPQERNFSTQSPSHQNHSDSQLRSEINNVQDPTAAGQQQQHGPTVAGQQQQHGQREQGYRFGDISRGVVARGKERRGQAATSSYKFGDFTRGLFGGS